MDHLHKLVTSHYSSKTGWVIITDSEKERYVVFPCLKHKVCMCPALPSSLLTTSLWINVKYLWFSIKKELFMLLWQQTMCNLFFWREEKRLLHQTIVRREFTLRSISKLIRFGKRIILNIGHEIFIGWAHRSIWQSCLKNKQSAAVLIFMHRCVCKHIKMYIQ